MIIVSLYYSEMDLELSPIIKYQRCNIDAITLKIT